MTSACRCFGNPVQKYCFLRKKKATSCRLPVALLSPCEKISVFGDFYRTIFRLPPIRTHRKALRITASLNG